MQPLVWIFWTNTQETQGPLHRPFAKQIGKFKASPFWATFDCACANPLYVNFRLRLQHDILTQRTQGRITHSAIYAMAYPRGHLLNFSYHITFYNYGSIRVWRRIRLFYHIAPVLKKHQTIFIKWALNPWPHGCPRLEHLLNFTLRYGYSLWYDQRDGIKNRTAAKAA